MTQHLHQHDSGQHALNIAGIDPFCGMTVRSKSLHETDLGGVHYRICGAERKTRFDADPAHYLNPQPQESAAAPGAGYASPIRPGRPETT